MPQQSCRRWCPMRGASSSLLRRSSWRLMLKVMPRMQCTSVAVALQTSCTIAGSPALVSMLMAGRPLDLYVLPPLLHPRALAACLWSMRLLHPE